jgi:hypothetical protein
MRPLHCQRTERSPRGDASAQAAPERAALCAGSDEANYTKASGETVAGPLGLRIVYKPLQKKEHDDRCGKHRCRVHQPKEQCRTNVAGAGAVYTGTKAAASA